MVLRTIQSLMAGLGKGDAVGVGGASDADRACDDVPSRRVNGRYNSSSSSTKDGGYTIPVDPCCGREPSRGRSSSAMSVRGDRWPGVLGTRNVHGTGRERPDGPSRVDGDGSSGGVLVAKAADDSSQS